jgi:hypothetical protein
MLNDIVEAYNLGKYMAAPSHKTEIMAIDTVIPSKSKVQPDVTLNRVLAATPYTFILLFASTTLL